MEVIIESPFANESPTLLSENLLYLNAVARKVTVEDQMNPLFFHSYYTQFLDDNNQRERNNGLQSSFEFHDDIMPRLITIDRGISTGMKLGMERGLTHGAHPVFISLDSNIEIQNALSEINSISDPKEKWEFGLKLIKKILPQEPINEYGDLTNYREIRNDLLEEVSTIIHRFFAPLVKHIEQK
ncbi:hypothetical protein OTK49_26570 [Vibrio coralliirubri]|uniref:DUF7768 domain-containing protein n=1 Tax=Vibrio coralliirubri TaxID=1516159 RepID=UPI002284A79A|nr:hypothetical protein [Vibrio coralliirubri]MCY9866105.1 hypothetical protein [Vibrio coralliirubri]